MATATTLPKTIEELSREILAPVVVTDDFARLLHSPPHRYKVVDAFHLDHCRCDECGAYKRVGIG